MLEKRFVMALRRLSSADGSSPASFSGSGGGGEVDSGVGEGSCSWGAGGLDWSANRRTWERILHCRQVDARTEGRLERRSGRDAGEEAIGSKMSLGASRAKGLMTSLSRGRRRGWLWLLWLRFWFWFLSLDRISKYLQPARLN
jgi:hypothetical protein